jgi:short-subunit dehydrogenase
LKDFKGKNAIITGGASGIGLALAKRCRDEGMHLILADIDESKLKRVKNYLAQNDLKILTVKIDVSKIKDIENLAKIALDTFEEIHLLFNNAGVFTVNEIWNYTLDDYKWIIGVNLWGTIHILHVFLPFLIKQSSDSYIVNTASIAGLLPGQGLYGLTKHAIVSLSESLYNDLNRAKINNVKVSVLCPTYVNTNLKESETYRPQELKNVNVDPKQQSKIYRIRWRKFERAVSKGQSVNLVVDSVFKGINEEKFYILTEDNPWWVEPLKKRVDYIKNGINPDDLPMSI